MTPERWKRIEELAEAALELEASQRAIFLESACVHDPDLRRQVERFLGAFEQIVTQDETRIFPGRPVDFSSTPRIQHYRLLREIGRGGMGTVYLAARSDEEFQRFVAVKLLRPGPGSEGLMNRFRSERQILANLDHPNIAKLLDGGTTDDGWPYLVMELIEGNRIDAYCDDHRLDVSQRIDLFREVCAAVQYAHRNLVVHRDIKPSNILVTNDGTPKLLDFGIAKLLDPTDFPYTVEATRTGLRPMTPPYASPEQLRGETITTASDVYSLGVLLYKLLTGRLPIATAGLSSQQIEKLLIEATPVKPSSAVSGPPPAENTTLSLETISRQRRTQSRQLTHQLAGDLDTIVLMALRKEPERRYGSVDQLSEDLRRYSKGLPVLARRDTFIYRTGKFLRRNKVAAGIVGSSFLLVTGFAATMARQAAQVARQRDRARKERDKAEKISTFLADLFELADPDKAQGKTLSAREILESGTQRVRNELKNQPETQAGLMTTVGRIYRKLGLYDQAEVLLREALELQEDLFGTEDLHTADALNELALLCFDQGTFSQAESLFKASLAIRRRRLEPKDPGIAEILINLAENSFYNNANDSAVVYCRESLEILEDSGDSCSPFLIRALTTYCGVCIRHGDQTLAESLQARALKAIERATEPEYLTHALALMNLGVIYATQGAFERAEPLFHQALTMLEKAVGASHLDTAICQANLASCQSFKGNYERAKKLYSSATEIIEDKAGSEHRSLASALVKLGVIYRKQGRHQRAETLFKRAMKIYKKTIREDDVEVAYNIDQLARVYSDQNHFSLAEPLFRKAVEIQDRVTLPNSVFLVLSLSGLASLLLKTGDVEEAKGLFLRASAATDRLVEKNPRDLMSKSYRAKVLAGLGETYRLEGQDDKAHEVWVRGLVVSTDLTSRSETIDFQVVHCQLLFYLGRTEEAVPLARRLLEIGWRTQDFLNLCAKHGLAHTTGSNRNLNLESRE